MDTIGKLKNLIETNDLNKSQIASEIGWSRERFHHFLNYGKSCDIDTYSKIRRAIENKGVRVDELDTMSIMGLAAHVNNLSSKLIVEVIQAVEDSCLTESEKYLLRSSIDKMIAELNELKKKL